MKIYLEGPCNNNCGFCQENRIQQSAGSQIKKKIKSFDPAKDKRIIFSSSEPTIRQDILELLLQSKQAQAEIIQLNTNARMFSDINFAKSIISSGANYFKISLHGHNFELHDKITQTSGSFNQTIKGIKNLIKLKQKDNIVIVIVLTKINYNYLNKILSLVRNLKLQKVQLNIVKTFDQSLRVPLSEIAGRIAWMRNLYLFDMLIKAKGVPYCLIENPESLFLKNINKMGYVFLNECSQCKYNIICPGILKEYASAENVSKIIPILDLPVEIMIEVESRCNFNCGFCFNRVSFAEHGFGGRKLETKYVKEIIDKIKLANISTVRFTGGEPLLNEDLLELIKYAHAQGLKVRLNTNGSLIESVKIVKEMAKYLNYVLFGMHAYNAKQDEMITGHAGSFEKKIRAMRWFKESGVEILRVNTIASVDNIKNLGKFYSLFKKIKVDRWAINRLIPISKEDRYWGKEEVSLLIKKLVTIKRDSIKRKIPMWIHIVNAIPLCAGDPVKLSAISSGGRAVDGHERFAIDPRKFAKPIYYMNENIGDPLMILECWNHPFMKSIRNYTFLPQECKACYLLERCKGGNRFSALLANDSYAASDPLMDFSRIENFRW